MLTVIRKFHRLIGITLMLPLAGWVVTGFVFFIKPGYAGAYEFLTPKTYPLPTSISISPLPGWREFRCFRTILGDHLIAKTDKGWLHLNLQTMLPREKPSEEEFRRLLMDAFSANPQRYGQISRISGDSAWTDTGVEVTLDWNRVSLQQRGKDTDRIDMLYRIHYLQWAGVGIIDKVLGFLGLVLVATLTVLGARLAFKRKLET